MDLSLGFLLAYPGIGGSLIALPWEAASFSFFENLKFEKGNLLPLDRRHLVLLTPSPVIIIQGSAHFLWSRDLPLILLPLPNTSIHSRLTPLSPISFSSSGHRPLPSLLSITPLLLVLVLPVTWVPSVTPRPPSTQHHSHFLPNLASAVLPVHFIVVFACLGRPLTQLFLHCDLLVAVNPPAPRHSGYCPRQHRPSHQQQLEDLPAVLFPSPSLFTNTRPTTYSYLPPPSFL